jgi:hypothetical protein
VKSIDQRVGQGSRWVLYHGTSPTRLKGILKEGRLRTSRTGDPKIALTTERSVAGYFACNAVFGDRHDRPARESIGVVLVLDGAGLLAPATALTPSRRSPARKPGFDPSPTRGPTRRLPTGA